MKDAITTFLFLYSTARSLLFFFFFNDSATTEIYTLSLHDALPISRRHELADGLGYWAAWYQTLPTATGPSARLRAAERSEEHTSELQSPMYLVCRLLLEKKKNIT